MLRTEDPIVVQEKKDTDRRVVAFSRVAAVAAKSQSTARRRYSPVGEHNLVVADAIAFLRLEEDTTACRGRGKLVETADAVDCA